MERAQEDGAGESAAVVRGRPAGSKNVARTRIDDLSNATLQEVARDLGVQIDSSDREAVIFSVHKASGGTSQVPKTTLERLKVETLKRICADRKLLQDDRGDKKMLIERIQNGVSNKKASLVATEEEGSSTPTQSVGNEERTMHLSATKTREKECRPQLLWESRSLGNGSPEGGSPPLQYRGGGRAGGVDGWSIGAEQDNMGEIESVSMSKLENTQPITRVSVNCHEDTVKMHKGDKKKRCALRRETRSPFHCMYSIIPFYFSAELCLT